MFTIGEFSKLCRVSARMLRYYDAICAWLAKNPEYKVAGPAIERYIKDENSVSDPDEFETGILFPVVKQ